MNNNVCVNNNRTTELLPCPFCGGKVIVWSKDKTEGLRIMHEFAHPYYRAVCQGGCGCFMGDFDTREEAITAWNTRAPIEYEGWFYLPKPKEKLVVYGETKAEKSSDGCYRMWQGVDVVLNAINSWGNELGEYVMQRICETWNTRAERTCRAIPHGYLIINDKYSHLRCWSCSSCAYGWHVSDNDKQYSYCPNCGAKVVNNED